MAAFATTRADLFDWCSIRLHSSSWEEGNTCVDVLSGACGLCASQCWMLLSRDADPKLSQYRLALMLHMPRWWLHGE